MQQRTHGTQDDADDVNVLAYGSNLFLDRMMGRCRSARVISIASLPRHSFRFHMRSTDGSGKADAHFTDDAEDCVEGVIYRMQPADLEVLDRYEGGYRRKLHHFEVHLEERTLSIDGWVYHARPERVEPGLLPFTWYHRYVVEGARYHGIAPDYVDAIARLRAVVDRRETLAVAAD